MALRLVVFTGYKLINVQSIKELAREGRDELAIYAATVGTIVATNLLAGVLVGIGLAVAKLLYTTQNLETLMAHDEETGKLTLHLMGVATFVGLPRLATALERVPAYSNLQVSLSRFATSTMPASTCFNHGRSSMRPPAASPARLG